MNQHLTKPSLFLAFAGVVTMATASGCVDGSPEPAIEQTRQPIIGGQAATECQWPTTVLLPTDGCSGTLVHPLIVITAAHCGTREKQIIFGETQGKPARSVAVESCQVFQPPNSSSATDWAFCKLKTPVTDVPIVPILMGCETDILKPGQTVVVSGFGETGAGSKTFGTKRWVETTINKLDTPTEGIQVGGMGKSPCFGDSGGPAFVKLADGSWRVFGIDKEGLGNGNDCTAGDLMTVIHKGVAWIEKQSGIDVTPCHDADGTWNPSAACTGFSLTPDSAGRAWANGCAEPTLTPPVTTCGPAFGGGADTVDGSAPLTDGSASRDSGKKGDGAGAKDAKPVEADADENQDAQMNVADSRPAKKEAGSNPVGGNGGNGGNGGSGVGGAGGEPDPGAGGGQGASSAASKGCSCSLGRRSDSNGAAVLPMILLVTLAGARARRRRRG